MTIKAKTVYFIRHGETGWNNYLRMQGHTDIGLERNGVRQAQRAAIRLRKSNARLICSSPLKRALTTAKIISGGKREIVIWPELIEQSYGDWEGSTLPYLLESEPELYARWRRGEKGFEIPNGETREESIARASHIVERLKQLEESEVIVTTHGGILRAIIVSIFGSESSKFLWNYKFNNCSITAIRFNEDEEAELLFINDDLHTKIDSEDEDELEDKIALLPLA